jgi:hypothetical protein
MAGSSPRPAWVSHRGEVQPTLEQLLIMLQHPQQNQFKIKNMAATSQNHDFNMAKQCLQHLD